MVVNTAAAPKTIDPKKKKKSSILCNMTALEANARNYGNTEETGHSPSRGVGCGARGAWKFVSGGS